MPGKVRPEELRSAVLTRTGAADEAVRQGPADGEDAAPREVGVAVVGGHSEYDETRERRSSR